MTDYCLEDPNECRWLNIETGEKSDMFLTISDALDFYFQRISGDIAIPRHEWWLQLNDEPNTTSPLARLLSKAPPSSFQQPTNFSYIPIKSIFDSNGINSQLSKYVIRNGIQRALFTVDYIAGYEIKSEKRSSIKTYVTRQGALNAVSAAVHDPEVKSYTINEWTMQMNKGLVCTSEEIITVPSSA
jgi:hypothetical protein